MKVSMQHAHAFKSSSRILSLSDGSSTADLASEPEEDQAPRAPL